MSRMIPGRTDHVCVRHYKMLSKEGPPRQKRARAVRQRSGRFVAWEKVNPSALLTAPPQAETLAIEGAPASAEEAHSAPSAAPAGTGPKVQRAGKAKRKAKRTKRKAQASIPGEEEELLVAGMDEDARPSACEDEAADARQSRAGVAKGMECDQKEPASDARQPPSKRGRSRKDAEGNHADKAAGAGNTENAKDTGAGRKRRASSISQGSRSKKPKAHGSAAGIVQEDTLIQSRGPQLEKGTMPVVQARRSTRKRKAG